MARGKLFAGFDKFVNSSKSATLKLEREAITRGEIPHCSSVGKIKAADLSDPHSLRKRLRGHGGKLRKITTIDGKQILVCKRCEIEMQSMSKFLKFIEEQPKAEEPTQIPSSALIFDEAEFERIAEEKLQELRQRAKEIADANSEP